MEEESQRSEPAIFKISDIANFEVRRQRQRNDGRSLRISRTPARHESERRLGGTRSEDVGTTEPITTARRRERLAGGRKCPNSRR
ncbi:hypothetical protein TNCV_2133661 [Trichonephila clavipes]|nr:hypothetical protein TNCV_2133661 [Trichonephila clavipes]